MNRFLMVLAIVLMVVSSLIAQGVVEQDSYFVTPSHAENDLVNRFENLTKNSKWELVRSTQLDFATGHPQGMARVDDFFFLSSVEVIKPTERYSELRDGYDRSPGEGIGLLFKMDLEGKLLDTLELGEGNVFHPGGIDYDGHYIWVPVAEYRPNSNSIIYRVDPATLEATEVLRFPDHIGGIVHDSDTGTLYGVSWGSRRIYTWHLNENLEVTNADVDPASIMTLNKAHYIDYQDCQYVGNNKMLCSGLSHYRKNSSSPYFPLGGIELVDLTSKTPIYQLPIMLFTEGSSSRVMTTNPFFAETTVDGLRFYFVPEDDTSQLYVYEVVTQ